MAAVTSAVVGIASGVGSAAIAFKNAKDQKELASDADKAAAKFMADARSKAEIDMYEGLTVPMDAYEAEFESSLAQQQTAVESLQEADPRLLAGGVGRLGAAATARDEATRIAMGKDISDLQNIKADSKEDINQQLIKMDAAAAREQNQRMRDAEAARAASIQQGVSGVTQALGSAADLVPLYGKNAADRRASKLIDKFGGVKNLKGLSRGELFDAFSTIDKDRYNELMSDNTLVTDDMFYKGDGEFDFYDRTSMDDVTFTPKGVEQVSTNFNFPGIQQ